MQTTNNPIIKLWRRTPLIAQIALGLILGILLGIFSPDTAVSFQLLGSIFIAGLKSVAPILVFILVISAIANHKRGQSTNIKPLIGLYAIGTLIAAFIAVGASSLMPAALNLTTGDTALSPPSGITEVLSTLVFNIVTNPVDALLNANYIGILTWAVLLGLGLQS
ncbi:MAG: cation:dicarboxylase symporter family transporter, partial [Gammaproteobacteria bacterium]|nr:cation:dicarboxylase symporter family transporter [Gammaproteobacteria bacterium]